MSPLTGAAVYLTIWWTALFAILPLGVRSHAEEGIEVPGGGEPASPVDPKLKKKFLTTSWVAAVFTILVWVVLRFGLIKLPEIPSGG